MNKPRQVSDFDRGYILCSNGTEYGLVENNIDRFELYDDYSNESKRVMRACQDDVNGIEPLPTVKNYTVEYPKKTVGSWDSVVLWLAVGFIVLFAVIETIKTIVLYVLGIHIWRGGLWYGVLFLDNILNGTNKSVAH